MHRIRATSRREASAVLYASRQKHQVMYCIDCCRPSAAPLAPVAQINTICSSPTRCCTNPISHVTTIGSIQVHPPRVCQACVYSKYLLCGTVWHARQFWEEHNHVTAVLLFTCSRRIIAWGQHVFVFRILIAPRKLLKCVPIRATGLSRCSMVLYNSLQVEFGFFPFFFIILYKTRPDWTNK